MNTLSILRAAWCTHSWVVLSPCWLCWGGLLPPSWCPWPFCWCCPDLQTPHQESPPSSAARGTFSLCCWGSGRRHSIDFTLRTIKKNHCAVQDIYLLSYTGTKTWHVFQNTNTTHILTRSSEDARCVALLASALASFAICLFCSVLFLRASTPMERLFKRIITSICLSSSCVSLSST